MSIGISLVTHSISVSEELVLGADHILDPGASENGENAWSVCIGSVCGAVGVWGLGGALWGQVGPSLHTWTSLNWEEQAKDFRRVRELDKERENQKSELK